MLWNWSETDLKLLWNCSETALTLLWNCNGTIVTILTIMTNGCEKTEKKGWKKAKYGEFLKLNMGKNIILSFFPHIKVACSLCFFHSTFPITAYLPWIGWISDIGLPAGAGNIWLRMVTNLELATSLKLAKIAKSGIKKIHGAGN